MKILIVDDLYEVRQLLRLQLERNKEWQTIEAGNGLDAIEKAANENPDAILMDYNMPILNGIEACRHLKANIDLSSIPVVIYTGAYASNVEGEARAAGCDDFLTKPIHPAELRASLENMINKGA